MEIESDIRHGRHCVFLMHVHLVFVTKYRREVFTKEILDDLRPMLASVCRDFEAELVEFDGEAVRALGPALKDEVCRATDQMLYH